MDSLYYEIHVTIEWSDRVLQYLDVLKQLAKNNGFHMGDLLLMKRDEERSHKDVFFTARADTYDEAEEMVVNFERLLDAGTYKVIRYKIEDTVLDSKINDKLGIL
jgi:hypothetical protein